MPMTASTLRRMLSFVRPYRRRLGTVMGLMVLATATGLAYPMVVRSLFDRVIIAHDASAMLPLAGWLVGLATAGFALASAQSFLYTALCARVLFDLRYDLFRHLQRLPLDFFKSTRLAEIVSRAGSDVAEIQNVSTGALISLLSFSLTLVGTIVMLAVLDARLFLVSSFLFPLGFIGARLLRRRVETLARQVREANAEVTGSIMDAFGGVETVRAAAAERVEAGRFVRASGKLVRKVLRFQLVQSLYTGSTQLVIAVNTLVVLWFGSRMALDGSLTWGGLVAFLVYLARLYGPVQGLAGLYLSVQKANAAAARVFELRDRSPEVEPPDAVRLTELRGEVALERVRVAPRPDQPILDGVSLAIPAGSFVAIVGPNGAGKTTLARALLGLAPLAGGRIAIDGVDLARVSLRSLRRRAALVTEEPFLFHASIEENVRYGHPSASRTDVEAALEAAGAARLVERLPEGLATVVGERAAKLSAGERQRIAIARALVGDPRLLVLDDPFGAVDRIDDEEIQAAIRPLVGGRTVVLTTHRVQIARAADRIVVLDRGRVVEEGSHEELLELRGMYARLAA
ncbi:MAG: ABC transporter ATP-binding protein [Deltaproteobacteria bacterium]|nr:ABC transporter ATP-binding protein [Deltaproteobacteria bacterium]